MVPTPMLMMLKGEEGFMNGVQSVDQLVLVQDPYQIFAGIDCKGSGKGALDTFESDHKLQLDVVVSPTIIEGLWLQQFWIVELYQM